jgi:23S rRNA pseudouridine1911/1915/1917 synthase
MTLLNIIISDSRDLQRGGRADAVLAEFEELPSRSQLKSWFEQGRVRRSGIVLKAKDRLNFGDQIEIDVPEAKRLELEPREYPLKVQYEDEHLIVVYKDRGMSMHPGANESDELTLVHALLAHADSLSTGSGYFRPGIVHRLDKDTEGLVVVAKDNKTHELLSRQFSERTIKRAYWALVWGKFPGEMIIEGAIGRHPIHRKKMAVVKRGGREAKTSVRLLKSFEEHSWVECRLHTGRTHQIRVHLSHKGFPILNDPVYCRARSFKDHSRQELLSELKGQALVAFELGFVHPSSGEALYFKADKPRWLDQLSSLD